MLKVVWLTHTCRIKGTEKKKETGTPRLEWDREPESKNTRGEDDTCTREPSGRSDERRWDTSVEVTGENETDYRLESALDQKPNNEGVNKTVNLPLGKTTCPSSNRVLHLEPRYTPSKEIISPDTFLSY